jgi:restriction system protein
VIAVKDGFCAVRIFDQVKLYKPGHLVTADEASALLGTVLGTPNLTKGIITTTSTFAPRIRENPAIRGAGPYRLELRDRDELLPFLQSLRAHM